MKGKDKGKGKMSAGNPDAAWFYQYPSDKVKFKPDTRWREPFDGAHWTMLKPCVCSHCRAEYAYASCLLQCIFETGEIPVHNSERVKTAKETIDEVVDGITPQSSRTERTKKTAISWTTSVSCAMVKNTKEMQCTT